MRRKKVTLHIAANRSRIKPVTDGREKRRPDGIVNAKADVRATVESPFQVIRRQFGSMKRVLPRIGQNHGPHDHTIRAVASADGTTAVVGDDEMIASAAVTKPKFRN